MCLIAVVIWQRLLRFWPSWLHRLTLNYPETLLSGQDFQEGTCIYHSLNYLQISGNSLLNEGWLYSLQVSASVISKEHITCAYYILMTKVFRDLLVWHIYKSRCGYNGQKLIENLEKVWMSSVLCCILRISQSHRVKDCDCICIFWHLSLEKKRKVEFCILTLTGKINRTHTWWVV